MSNEAKRHRVLLAGPAVFRWHCMWSEFQASRQRLLSVELFPMRRIARSTFLFAFAMLMGLTTLVADEHSRLKIGDPVPGWKQLAGIDDKQHSLDDLKDKAVVVVCFTCNSCLYSVDYEDRLTALHKKYENHPAGVAVVAINSNRKPSETLEKMKERAHSKQFSFPYLIDETQAVASSFGAVYTPEFFVLNKDRKVVFIGAMDDKTDSEQVTVRYVELAVEASLNDTLPETTEVPVRGCAIPYKRNRK